MGLLFSYSVFRILRWGLVSKRDESWVFPLRHVRVPTHQIRCPSIRLGMAFQSDLLCRFPTCFRSVAGATVHSSLRFTVWSSSLHISLFACLVAEILVTYRIANRVFNLVFSWFTSCVSHEGNKFLVRVLTRIIGLWSRAGNLITSFSVLTNASVDPTIIGGKTVEVFHTILKYSYVDLLLACFLLTLDNRPQGSGRGHALAFVGSAIFTSYVTVHHHD